MKKPIVALTIVLFLLMPLVSAGKPAPDSHRQGASSQEEGDASEADRLPLFWLGLGAHFAGGLGTSVGDGSREYRPATLMPLRLDGWVIPLSWLALRLSVAYQMMEGSYPADLFVPTLALRFGKARTIRSTWSFTLYGGYSMGWARTWDSWGDRYQATASGTVLGCSIDARIYSTAATRHTLSAGLEVGDLSGEMVENQYDRWRLWALVTLGISLSWGL